MHANIDGAVPALGRLLEVKTASRADDWGEDGSDQVPDYYMPQLQHYLSVIPVDVIDVAVLIYPHDLRVLHVEADHELQEMIIDAEHDFWQLVQTNQPPPLEGLEDVRRRYGQIANTGSVVALAEDIEAVERLRETVQLMHELEATENAAKAKLMARLGDAGDVLIHPETNRIMATWKLAKPPMRFDAEAFAKDHPDLWTQYRQPGSASRRFLLKDIPK